MLETLQNGVRAFRTAFRLGYSWRDCFIAAKLFMFRRDLVQAVLRDRLNQLP